MKTAVRLCNAWIIFFVLLHICGCSSNKAFIQATEINTTEAIRNFITDNPDDKKVADAQTLLKIRSAKEIAYFMQWNGAKKIKLDTLSAYMKKALELAGYSVTEKTDEKDIPNIVVKITGADDNQRNLLQVGPGYLQKVAVEGSIKLGIEDESRELFFKGSYQQPFENLRWQNKWDLNQPPYINALLSDSQLLSQLIAVLSYYKGWDLIEKFSGSGDDLFEKAAKDAEKYKKALIHNWPKYKMINTSLE